MSLVVVTETLQWMKEQGTQFNSAEVQLITQFAFKSGDEELTKKLIAEVAEGETDLLLLQNKYEAMLEAMPRWISKIENLLVALEMYRLEEEKAIHRLRELLQGYGVMVSEEELRTADLSEVKERLRKEAMR